MADNLWIGVVDWDITVVRGTRNWIDGNIYHRKRLLLPVSHVLRIVSGRSYLTTSILGGFLTYCQNAMNV